MNDSYANGATTEDQQPAEDQGASGYCIEIHVGGDGKIRVGVEPESAEVGEEGGAEGQSGQSVSGIKEAVQFALDAYKAGGKVPAPMEGEDDFNSGFGGNPAASKFA